MKIVARVLCSCICFASLGCEWFPEASFDLADSSRLPKWIVLPSNFRRADVTLTMSYYSNATSRTARFVLQDRKKKELQVVNGKLECDKPFGSKTGSDHPVIPYPGFEIVRADGMTEVIEHKRPEPLFYVSDDLTVLKQFERSGCGQ